ncbi:MAG: aminotransferase class IV [Rikenellaceae bacterium]
MQTPYLYQIVHTKAYRAIHLAEHCDVLERCFWQFQFRRVSISRDDIAQKIEQQLRQNGVNARLSTHVEIRLYLDGKVSVDVVEKSIYEGFTLRCFNPYATLQTYDNPMGDYPTSARRAAAELALHRSRIEGADVAIRCGTDGVVYSCYDSPIFGVKGHTIFSSPSQPCVERSMGIYAIQRCGYEFVETPIKKEQLPKFDELFWCDAYGVTAIAQYTNRRYMSIISAKIAEQMR